MSESGLMRWSKTVVAVLASVLSMAIVLAASAATLSPPMLDISRQCEVASGRNVTAMSECVVAESIARSELLRKWDKLADADVERCLKVNRKVKHRPYGSLAKCLAVAGDDAAPAPPNPVRDGTK